VKRMSDLQYECYTELLWNMEIQKYTQYLAYLKSQDTLITVFFFGGGGGLGFHQTISIVTAHGCVTISSKNMMVTVRR
jgi:hypothetical protein